MSRIFQELYQRGRDARKPADERRRYAVYESDPGHANLAQAKAAGKVPLVRLDGAPIQRVLIADEIQGYVVTAVWPLRVVGDEILKATKHGVVAVDLIDP